MFKLNNKITLFSGVSIVDYEQVNVNVDWFQFDENNGLISVG